MRMSLSALAAHRLRSMLSVLGIAIGITAVILLTSIGEGTRSYILAQFTQFGTNILAINPGKSETLGIPGVTGGTTHKLTLDDAEALERVNGVLDIVPLAIGMARVEAGSLGRSVFIYGVTSAMPAVWKFRVGQGSFLPEGDPRRVRHVTVLGPSLKRELFGNENALGRFVRIAGVRLRVIGIMEAKGSLLGQDLGDCAYVPVATAMDMFNQDELFEIDLTFAHEGMTAQVKEDITLLLTERHRNNEDFTITTQDAMLSVFDNVMNVITVAVGGIGAISLLVGVIGILTMMWITVGERTAEIGLLRALGATSRQVLGVFLAEAITLSVLGGLTGIGLGAAIAAVLRRAIPDLPLQTPPEYVIAAVVASAIVGLLSGVLPARRAAGLDPVEALRAE
jgi:putative ABC transport system permease protein